MCVRERGGEETDREGERERGGGGNRRSEKDQTIDSLVALVSVGRCYVVTCSNPLKHFFLGSRDHGERARRAIQALLF